jgi:hypothetical protein
MVSILFTRQDSIYKTLGVDCWDIDRNALNWPGGNPVVCHPPCRAWGQLSQFAKPREGERELAVWAIEQVRKYGGVLEHPRASRLWKELCLPLGKETDEYGGYSLCVNQSWWGHKAQKKTLLYIVGCNRNELPEMPIKLDLVQFIVASSVRKGHPKYKPEISKKEREATPVDFAKWLIAVAERCKKHRFYGDK